MGNRKPESGVRSQESGVRSQESGARSQESGAGPGPVLSDDQFFGRDALLRVRFEPPLQLSLCSGQFNLPEARASMRFSRSPRYAMLKG
jgi:hypothetical protein